MDRVVAFSTAENRSRAVIAWLRGNLDRKSLPAAEIKQAATSVGLLTNFHEEGVVYLYTLNSGVVWPRPRFFLPDAVYRLLPRGWMRKFFTAVLSRREYRWFRIHVDAALHYYPHAWVVEGESITAIRCRVSLSTDFSEGCEKQRDALEQALNLPREEDVACSFVRDGSIIGMNAEDAAAHRAFLLERERAEAERHRERAAMHEEAAQELRGA